MATEDKEVKVSGDILSMSDEEMANFDPSTLVSSEEAETKEEDTTVEDKAASTEETADTNTETEKEDQDEDAEKDEVDSSEEGDDKEEEKTTDADADKGKAEQKDDSKQEVKEEKVDDKTKEIDYKAAYEQLTSTFKANGKDMKVDTVEDARALMQMGANYNKKMAALKPSLKLLKLLESNGLLDEGKLGFLIDLDKRNPEAINKLVKDSGIDPMDLSAEKAGEYKPSTYTVDERELELDAVLGDIEDTPTYKRTLEVVSNKWDGASRQTIAETPQILSIINTHMESGIYDLIQAEMEREKMFGRLKGLSDLQAYQKIGDKLNADGAFVGLGVSSKATNPGQKEAPKVIVVEPKPVKVVDETIRNKKRAASSTKAASGAVKQDFHPLAMSDEEFSKQVYSKFL